jgi:4-deoxy-L-threo-5-hexosulose-uronate ketol-isomerase
MEIRYQHSPREVAKMDSKNLRASFLIENVFEQNQVRLVYSHYDRVIIGGVMPSKSLLELPNYVSLKAEYFLERRELGIINVGGKGKVIVDEVIYEMDKLDCLYIGKGTEKVSFASIEQPLFFLMSSPAHHRYPTRLMLRTEATPTQLGSLETANQRTIYKYIHLDGIQSCQLVMGLTLLNKGSVWNTMSPHIHDRRMEAYFYFDVPENQGVLHLMGEPHETRHLWINNYQAVISPPWSIHSGCGTTNYGFIWGMAGENQSFTDMDLVSVTHLK